MMVAHRLATGRISSSDERDRTSRLPLGVAVIFIAGVSVALWAMLIMGVVVVIHWLRAA